MQRLFHAARLMMNTRPMGRCYRVWPLYIEF